MKKSALDKLGAVGLMAVIGASFVAGAVGGALIGIAASVPAAGIIAMALTGAVALPMIAIPLAITFGTEIWALGNMFRRKPKTTPTPPPPPSAPAPSQLKDKAAKTEFDAAASEKPEQAVAQNSKHISPTGHQNQGK